MDWQANQLRQELGIRNRRYARGRSRVESYGSLPVVVYAPENGCHGNFFDPAYTAITENPKWMRRFDKVHAQARRNLPKAERRWRELDSSMSSDALLMNVFCTPGVAESSLIRNALGVECDAVPVFGWKARVPLSSGRFDRTEVDMRFGALLVEAKLTESDFQTCLTPVAEAYRDFDLVFERDMLPRVELATARPRRASEFPENDSQEFESVVGDPDSFSIFDSVVRSPSKIGYAGYQLIRNVLAAYDTDCSFCVIHDARRPDLGEGWFRVIAAVKRAEMRTRLKILTWQELSAFLPIALQNFLDLKYGIVAPGRSPSSLNEAEGSAS
jgi:hypothetical protein